MLEHEPKVCYTQILFLKGKLQQECPNLTNPTRPKWTKYCDKCLTHYSTIWSRSNAKTLYNAADAKEKRERWAENHDGQTWAQYVAKSRDKLTVEEKRERDRRHKAASRQRKRAIVVRELAVSKPREVSKTNSTNRQSTLGPVPSRMNVPTSGPATHPG